MAIGLRTLALVIILVVVLRRPEVGGGRYARYDTISPGPQFGDEPFGHTALLGRAVEDLRTILVPDIGALTVELGRIVDLEKRRASSS